MFDCFYVYHGIPKINWNNTAVYAFSMHFSCNKRLERRSPSPVLQDCGHWERSCLATVFFLYSLRILVSLSLFIMACTLSGQCLAEEFCFSFYTVNTYQVFRIKHSVRGIGAYGFYFKSSVVFISSKGVILFIICTDKIYWHQSEAEDVEFAKHVSL